MHAFSHFVFSLVSYISLALCSSHALSQIQVIVFTHQVSSVKRFQFHVIRQAIFMPYLKLDRSTQEWTMSCRDRCLFRLLSTTFSGNLHTIGSLYVNTNIKKFFKDMKHGFFFGCLGYSRALRRHFSPGHTEIFLITNSQEIFGRSDRFSNIWTFHWNTTSNTLMPSERHSDFIRTLKNYLIIFKRKAILLFYYGNMLRNHRTRRPA